jgi:hypothetical protein
MAEWKKVLVSGSAVDVTSLKLSSVVNASTDTDKFLVLDGSGNVDFRTGTQVLSDIGAGTGGGDITRVNITAGSGLDGTIDTTTGDHTQTLRLDIDGLSDIGADLVDADILAVDDGAGGTNRKASMTRLTKYMQGSLTFTTNTNTQNDAAAIRTKIGSGNNGHVPTAGSAGEFLKHDGTFGTPSYTTNTNTQNDAAAIRTKVGTGNSGVVPAAGSAGEFLKHDGTFGTPSYTTNTDTNTFRGIRVDTTGNGDADNTLGASETLMLKKGTNITLSEALGVITISSTDTNTDTQLTATEVRANLSGTGLIGYNSTTGVISTTANNYSLSAADVKSVLGGGMPSNALTIGDSSDTITIAGNLDVNGTTTTIDTTNLAVADKFIELNRGASTEGDGGIVINGATNKSFGWDDSADRWAFDFTGASASQTTIGADAYVSAVVTTDDSNYRKNGNIRVTSGDVYIYVE